ncbi:MAG: nucleotidyltransferase family protein [Paracoccaceae bacterium]
MRYAQYPLMMFAAGFGTRMKHLTQDQPKPLVNVEGRPLIDHALDLAKGANCDPIAANLHYLADRLEHHLTGTGVTTITELPEILDTGGGLRNALPVLGDGPVMTLNPDAIWDGPNPLDMLRTAWRPDKMDALLICVPIAQTVGRMGTGDFDLNSDDQITRGTQFVYGGAQIVKTDGLRDITETSFSLNILWDQLSAKDRLFGLRYPGRWCDVGTPEGVSLAEHMLRDAHG